MTLPPGKTESACPNPALSSRLLPRVVRSPGEGASGCESSWRHRCRDTRLGLPHLRFGKDDRRGHQSPHRLERANTRRNLIGEDAHLLEIRPAQEEELG